MSRHLYTSANHIRRIKIPTLPLISFRLTYNLGKTCKTPHFRKKEGYVPTNLRSSDTSIKDLFKRSNIPSYNQLLSLLVQQSNDNQNLTE